MCAATAEGGASHAADIAALLLRAGADAEARNAAGQVRVSKRVSRRVSKRVSDAEARNAGGQTAGELAEAIGALGLATLLAQVGLNAPSVPV